MVVVAVVPGVWAGDDRAVVRLTGALRAGGPGEPGDGAAVVALQGVAAGK